MTMKIIPRLISVGSLLAACHFAPSGAHATPDSPQPDAPIDAAVPDVAIDAPSPPTLVVGSAAPACSAPTTAGATYATPTFAWTGSDADGAAVAVTCASGSGSAAPSPLPVGSACTSGASFGPFTQGDYWVAIAATNDFGITTTYVDAFTVDVTGPQVILAVTCGSDSAEAVWTYTPAGTYCPAISGLSLYHTGSGTMVLGGDPLGEAAMSIPIRPHDVEIYITDPAFTTEAQGSCS